MAAYTYFALSEDGKKKKGAIEADSEKLARQVLRSQGLSPIEVKEIKSQKKRNFSLFNSNSLSNQELSLIARQLGSMLEAGLPLDEALTAASNQTDRRRIKSILLAVRGKILEGNSLATAFGGFPNAFPNMFGATVSAGERSGNLGLILNQLADHTEASSEFQQQVGMALIYPIILTIVAIAIIFGLMLYVVPDIIKVFTDMGQELPALTKALIGFTSFIENRGYWLVIIALCLSFFLVALLRNENVVFKFHKSLLRLPIIRKFSRGYNTTKYASTLYVLVHSGVPLVESMEIANQVVPNKYLKTQLTSVTTKVREGMSLSAALARTNQFPPILVHMIASGEASGKLDEMLLRASSSQERELKRWITTLVNLFEPLTLVIMGGIVMLIVLAILLPILNMNQLVV